MAALVNIRTQRVVASHVELALTRQDRKRGLLGRTGLATDAAMFIAPCVAVHTVGMQFPIDVAFVDREGRAVRLVHNMQPWRLAASARARAVIEFPAGRLAACGVQVGDELFLDKDHRPAETPFGREGLQASGEPPRGRGGLQASGAPRSKRGLQASGHPPTGWTDHADPPPDAA